MQSLQILILSIVFVLFSPIATAQNKYALLVGVSNYHAIDKSAEWNDIHGVNDINLISPELTKQKFQIATLLDAQATKANIVAELRKLAKSVTKGSIVYIHFSMHGQLFDDALSPTKQDEVWDESLVPVDARMRYDKNYKGENHLVDDELNEYTEAIRTKIGTQGMLYVVIDACHAGNSKKGDNRISRGVKTKFSHRNYSQQPKAGRKTIKTIPTKPGQSPVVYLEACESHKVNFEINMDGKYYGPMSYFIAKTLQKTKLGTDKAWIDDVQSQMSQCSKCQNQTMVIERSN